MKKRNLLVAFSILVLAALACNASLPQAATPTATAIAIPTQANSQTQLTEAGVPRISVQDAKAAFDSGQAIIVDVRSAGAYAEGHAAGAISIPLENFENNIGNLSLKKDQWIITYCT